MPSSMLSTSVTSMPRAPMWRVGSGQLLEHRGWGDEFVIYNSLSGDTHLIDADAMDILLLLQGGAADNAALLAALAHSGAMAEDASNSLAMVLDQLQSLSLVERV